MKAKHTPPLDQTEKFRRSQPDKRACGEVFPAITGNIHHPLLHSSNLLALQRIIGNRAVGRLLGNTYSSQRQKNIQRLTKTKAPDGEYEQHVPSQVVEKRKSDKNKYANYAAIEYTVFQLTSDQKFVFYESGWIVRHNVGMQSTHAEEMCWRELISLIEEKSGQKLSYQTTWNELTKKGISLHISFLFSEREPCKECEKYLNFRLGEDMEIYYLVDYQGVQSETAANELEAWLNTIKG